MCALGVQLVLTEQASSELTQQLGHTLGIPEKKEQNNYAVWIARVDLQWGYG